MVRFPEPLGELSETQIQSAFDRFDLGRVVHVEPTTTGNFNQNIFVTTTEGAFVFRGAPHFDWQFPKERYFAKLIHDRTSVPGPWPYVYEPSRELFGWPFAIMPRLPGIQVADPRKLARLSLEDRHGIAKAQGETLARLHVHSFPMNGEYDLSSDSVQPFQSTYADWVAGEIDRLIATTEVLTPPDAAWIESLVHALLPAARTQTANVIVHGDFTYNNMAFARTGNDWAVSGVFDLMTAVLGDGIADLVRQYAMYLNTQPPLAPVFVDAYLESTDAGSSFDERFHLYLLHERLIVRDFAFRHEVDWLDWDIGCRDWFRSYFRGNSLQSAL